MSKLTRLTRGRPGANAIEYGLVAALISVGCIGASSSATSKMPSKYADVGVGL